MRSKKKETSAKEEINYPEEVKVNSDRSLESWTSIILGETIQKSCNESRFLLDEDSICYGCKYYNDDEDLNNCVTPQSCVEGSMNGYRMDG